MDGFIFHGMDLFAVVQINIDIHLDCQILWQWSWWLSGWLQVFMGLFLVFIAVGGYWWHLHNLKTQRELLILQVTERTKELAALYTITAVVSNTLDLDETLAVALSTTLDLLTCEAGGIHLLQEDGAQLALVRGCCLSQDVLTKLEHVSLKDSFLQTAVQPGNPIIQTDLAKIDEIPFYADGFRWLAVSPLTTRGSVLGTLFMLRKNADQFSAPNNELLASIGNQIGVAIENARLYEQAQQLAIAEERTRLARDLHDSVTQSIYSLTLLVEAGRRMIQNEDMLAIQRNQERLGVIAQRALQEMRLLVFELRPLDLYQSGLVAAIEHRLEIVERRAGVEVQLQVSEDIHLTEVEEDVFYRIAHEALNNALKHAQATAVSVVIDVKPETILLIVQDNGRGFDLTLAQRMGGLGLVGMRERVEKLNGRFTVTSMLGAGTTIRAELPLIAETKTAVLESTS